MTIFSGSIQTFHFVAHLEALSYLKKSVLSLMRVAFLKAIAFCGRNDF